MITPLQLLALIALVVLVLVFCGLWFHSIWLVILGVAIAAVVSGYLWYVYTVNTSL